MRRLRRMLAKLYSFSHSKGADADLEREIKSHLALLQEDYQNRGMTPDQAWLAARRTYGGVEQAKELHRDERSVVWLEQAWQDVRHACRSLANNPGFTLVAIITVALGIGVNTTLFTVFNALALKPLPVASPNEVVRLKRWFESPARGDVQYGFSYPEYVFLRDHNSVFSSLVAASWPLPVLLGSDKLIGQLVSINYFASLGIGARLGRTFVTEDGTPGASPVVVLSHPFWQRWFNSDPTVLGRILKLNGTAFTIIGVAPEEFTGTSVVPETPNFWMPVWTEPQLVPGSHWLRGRDDYRFHILGRVQPSISFARAQVESDGLIRQYAATFRERDKTQAVTLHHTRSFAEADDIRFQALVAGLMLIVGMVLLIACANLANMLLSRSVARQREIGTRLALGASRGRVVRHLLTESILLSIAGGTAGVVLSSWTSKLLWMTIQEMLELVSDPAGSAFFKVNLNADFRVFGYALLLSIATGILFGLSPALQSTSPDLSSALKDEGTPLSQRLSRSRFRSLLVGGQVAASMVLLISAGFLTRGLLRSESVDVGFETKRVYLLFDDFGKDAIKAASGRRALLDRLRNLPQLRNAAIGGIPMLGTWTPPIVAGTLSGRTLASYASEAYFDTLGIPLVRGRGFTKQEAQKALRVAVISELTARLFWPNQDPIGKQFQLDMDFRGTLVKFEVIGVVKDVRYANLTRLDPAHTYLAGYRPENSGMLLRVQGDAPSAMAAVRKVVEISDKDLLPSLRLIGMEQGPLRLQKSLAHAYGTFALILAALALTLTAVGIYGVMAYLVTQRVKEIGIRMALGATRGGVLTSVVLQGLRPVFAGIALGVVGAAGLASVLNASLILPGSTDLFFGVAFYDPVTFLALSWFVAAVAGIASFVPARRALGIDPMMALRHE